MVIQEVNDLFFLCRDIVMTTKEANKTETKKQHTKQLRERGEKS